MEKIRKLQDYQKPLLSKIFCRKDYAVGEKSTALPKVTIVNQQKDLKISARSARRIVHAICELELIKCSEIVLYFVTEKKISKLHEHFFNDPTPTDCITFPIDQEILGEIFICPKTALKYCFRNKLDPYEETTLYIIHGILHLLGELDTTLSERRSMRKKEKKCMAHLKTQQVHLSR